MVTQNWDHGKVKNGKYCNGILNTKQIYIIYIYNIHSMTTLLAHGP